MAKQKRKELINKLQELIGNDFALRMPGEGDNADVPNVVDTNYQTNIGFPGFTQAQPGSGIEVSGNPHPAPTFAKSEPLKTDKKEVTKEAPLGKTPIPNTKQKEPADLWKKPFSGEASVLSKEDKKILQEPPPQTPKDDSYNANVSAKVNTPSIPQGKKVILGGDDEVKEQNIDPNKQAAEYDPTGAAMPGEAPAQNQKVPQQAQDPNAGMIDPNAGMDPNMGMDPNAGMGGMGGTDPMTGMPIPPPQTAEDIGRVYELKKIYSRLVSIEEHLSTSSDEILIKLKEYVTKVIELFETVISNIEPFRDKIDDIIIIFYKFLESVYGILRKYYHMKQMEEDQEKEETLPAMKISNIINRYKDKKDNG